VELIAIIAMIIVGGATAVMVMIVIAIAQRGAEVTNPNSSAPDRSRLASSILFQLLLLGGLPPDEALRDVRRRAGLASPVTSGIDVTNWGERFAQLSTPEQRAWLLQTAVELASGRGKPLPLRQYTALLDLSFALGFQTDALAKLREQYGFEYVDHAKDGRPREADRAGGAAPLYARQSVDPAPLLRLLGIEGPGSRQAVISAYRRLAAQHHPDRVFGEPEQVQSEAAARFIEITRAYETLLAHFRD
jgi:DnaJ-like protein